MNTRIKEAWTVFFTDPSQHNPKKFAYLVTGIHSAQEHNNAIQYFKSKMQYDREQDLDLNLYPNHIHKIKMIHSRCFTSPDSC